MDLFRAFKHITPVIRLRIYAKGFHNCPDLAMGTKVCGSAIDLKRTNEWNIFFNHLKYLKSNFRECNFRTCVSILINFGHYLLQYNRTCGFNNDDGILFEWNVGDIRSTNIKPFIYDRVEQLNPPLIFNVLEVLSKIRLFDRIYRLRPSLLRDKTVDNIVVQPESGDIVDNSKYSGLFQSIIDEIPADSFKINVPYKARNRTRLRYNTVSLVSHPSIFSEPFYFELYNFPRAENKIGHSEYLCASDDGFYIVEHIMNQFLDQVLVFIKTSEISPSLLCVLSKHLEIIVYGPKLRNSDTIVVSDQIDRSFKAIVEYIAKTILSNGHELSFRSLVYLVNTGVHNPGVLDYISSRITETDDNIDLHYIGKLTFAFTRAYYDNDKLYERLAQMINDHREYFTPTVTANLIFSFSRVSKLHLVQEKLFKNLQRYQSYEYGKCKRGLIQSLLLWLESNKHTDIFNRVNAEIEL